MRSWVLIRSDHPDGIFKSRTVRLIRDLTAEFARLPGVNASDIMSLANHSSGIVTTQLQSLVWSLAAFTR